MQCVVTVRLLEHIILCYRFPVKYIANVICK